VRRGPLPPLHPRTQIRHCTRKPGLLAFAQFRTQFNDGVGHIAIPLRRERGQNAGRKFSAASTELDDAFATGCECRRTLLGHTGSKQRRQFRRGYEISCRPEFVCPTHVVTKPRRIERKIHEALKRQKTVSSLDFGLDARK